MKGEGKKTEMVHVRVSPVELRWIRKHAAKNRVTESEYLRRGAILDMLLAGDVEVWKEAAHGIKLKLHEALHREVMSDERARG